MQAVQYRDRTAVSYEPRGMPRPREIEQFLERAWLPSSAIRRWRRPWMPDEWMPATDLFEREGKLAAGEVGLEDSIEGQQQPGALQSKPRSQGNSRVKAGPKMLRESESAGIEGQAAWRLFCSHGTLLFHVACHPGCTIPDIADALALSQRTVWGLIGDLRRAGLLTGSKRRLRRDYCAACASSGQLEE